MDYSSNRNYKCRIREYTHKGLRTLSLENELIAVTVLLDKGSDVYEVIHKQTDTDFMWKAPGGLRDPAKHVPTGQNPAGSFLDFYEGGWQECLPGGGPFIHLGADIGLHGEACLMPWGFHVVEDSPEEICVLLTCETYRFPFRIEKRISLKSGSMSISFEEEVTNTSAVPIEFMWGHHPAIGKPFLSQNCRIDVPAKEYQAMGRSFAPESDVEPDTKGEWPSCEGISGKKLDFSIVPAENANTGDLMFLSGLEEGWFAVTDEEKQLGIGMSWDEKTFPYVWYWMVSGGVKDYPWYGATYNIALEPWSSIPSTFAESQKRGTTLKLEGGATLSTDYKMVIYEGMKRVRKITRDGTVEAA